MELLSKVEQLKSDNDKIEHALELQQAKIKDLLAKAEELENLNHDNASVIESLRLRNDDYKAAVDHKNSVIAQLEKVTHPISRKSRFCSRNTRPRTVSTIWCWRTACATRTCWLKSSTTSTRWSRWCWRRRRSSRPRNSTSASSGRSFRRTPRRARTRPSPRSLRRRSAGFLAARVFLRRRRPISASRQRRRKETAPTRYSGILCAN